MKKTLLFCAALVTAASSYGQALQTIDFEALNVGNLGTQGGFSTYLGTAANYAVTAGHGGKYLNITSGTGTGTGTSSPSRFAWIDGLGTAWNSRTAGNNVLKVAYDFFTGPANTTSAMGGGIDVYEATDGNYVASITVDGATKTAYGISTIGSNINLVPLGTGTTNVTLPANSWVRLSFAYNTLNGDTRFLGPGFDKTTTGNNVYTPNEADFAVQVLSSNANITAMTFGFDNLNIEAISTTAYLGTEEVQAKAISLEIFPNPAADYLSVQTPEKIEKVYLYTADGIRMDAELIDGKVNVSALPKGVYMLGVKTAKTYATKKFIKK